MRKSLAIRMKVLGADHPDTKSTMGSLEVIEQKLKGPPEI